MRTLVLILERQTGMFLRALTILALCLLAGCTPKWLGMAKLKELCEKDAGFEIFRTVEASGLHHYTGDINIVASPYEFIEFCDDTGFLNYDYPEPGCYRMKKVDRSQGKCHEELDARLSEFIVDPFPEFLTNSCISVESIVAPTARYFYDGSFDDLNLGRSGEKYRRTEIRVSDTLTNTNMAVYVSYSYMSNTDIPSSIHCSDLSEKYTSFARINLLESVIRPKS